MKKLVFISDFFVNEINGGGEICDDVLISELRKRGVKVCSFRSREVTTKHIQLYKNCGFTFLVSNFVTLSEKVKKYLTLNPGLYSIMEHDHKYLKTRNPSVFAGFKAPPQFVINKSFYSAAKNVFCQSVKHAEVLSLNLGINNVVNLGCSLWTSDQLKKIKDSIKDKNNKAYIINDSNKIKGTPDAIRYCEEKKLAFDLQEKKSYDDFIDCLGEYSSFVFFPQTLETFSRIILEARMLGCKIVTNSNNGCTYEPWFKDLKGEELVDFVDNRRDEIVSLIQETTGLPEKTFVGEGDITVILNCYRRPYNLKMQVEALKAQSVPPKEIWLWVNYHEDNKDFDPSSLGVDHVFNNDFNWKFYGRFAAALLADTEYVAIYDDDTIPGNRWHENCLNTMEMHEGMLGTHGLVQKSHRSYDLERVGWPSHNSETKRVDYVGHCWFFKRKWLRYLWFEVPPTWDNGEDIQFSYCLQRYANIQTYVPPHPMDKPELHGSLLGAELGIDDKATSNNIAKSHKDFFSERDRCVKHAFDNGWSTVNKVKWRD